MWSISKSNKYMQTLHTHFRKAGEKHVNCPTLPHFSQRLSTTPYLMHNCLWILGPLPKYKRNGRSSCKDKNKNEN